MKNAAIEIVQRTEKKIPRVYKQFGKFFAPLGSHSKRTGWDDSLILVIPILVHTLLEGNDFRYPNRNQINKYNDSRLGANGNTAWVFVSVQQRLKSRITIFQGR